MTDFARDFEGVISLYREFNQAFDGARTETATQPHV